jgi:3-demethoxyubiquinol 3-hydroxylase
LNLSEPSPAITVFFDGGCPLCRREVGLYQRASVGLPVRWQDVSDFDATLPQGLNRQAALERFHVLRHGEQPELLSGARAFTLLWKQIPGWKWLGVLGSVPPVTVFLETAYSSFLRLRPKMQTIARALEPAVSQSPPFMVRDFRSDHAGETGAVWIYKGILLLAKDPTLINFAKHHLATEQKHLDLMNGILPWRQRSRLLVFWKIAGFITGFLPALVSSRAVYATVASVEVFVDQHYQEQIEKLQTSEYPGLLNTLLDCQADERGHRDEALAFVSPAPGLVLKTWCAVVGFGSAQAVKLAKLI